MFIFYLKHCFLGCSTGEIRLEEGGSENPYEGRVEVCLSGRWVTVCDDQWGAQDARVVCRNMGYPSSGKFNYISFKYNFF